MTILDTNTEICNLRAEEERILASFTRRLIEIATVAGTRGSGTSPTAALNAMHLPAIALDQHGFVADVNAAADGISTMISRLRISGFSFAIRTPEPSSKKPSIN
jgi:hypothetical protein